MGKTSWRDSLTKTSSPGVLEANFIEPAHDKQDFERSSLFQRLEARLRRIILDYWKSRSEAVGYHPHFRAPKSRRTATPDQPPSDDTFNPSPLPSDKISQGGPVIREISLSKGTSSRTVALPPPHMRNFTGVRSNFQPVQPNHQPVQPNHQPLQLNPQPAATESGDNLGGKSAYKLSEENIQLFMECEEYAKKETEMEQTVRNLEKELEEAKSKCALLALLVNAKKMEIEQV